MTLTVEIGQAAPESNSYLSEADAIRLLPSFLMEEWNAYTPDERIDRLVIASHFINDSFAWLGKRKTFEQGLAWPRTGVIYQGHLVPDNRVPPIIKRACIAALKLIQQFGLEVFQATGEAQVKRERLAVIETEYFDPGLKVAYETAYNDINNMLRGFYAAMPKGGVVSSEVIRV